MRQKIILLLFCFFLLFSLGGSGARTFPDLSENVEREEKQEKIKKEDIHLDLSQDLELMAAEPEAAEVARDLIIEIDEEDLDPEVAELYVKQPDEEEIMVVASEDSAQMFYCKGTGEHTLGAGAVVENKVISMDDYYYLLRVSPLTGKMNPTPVAYTLKTDKVLFEIDTRNHPEYVQSNYCIAVRNGVGFTRISSVSSVLKPEELAQNKEEYEVARTKKGIQELDIEELLETKSSQVFINLPLGAILPLDGNTVNYEYDGEVYLFSSMTQVREQVRQCNEHQIVVTAQILLDRADPSLILEGAREGNASFYAWNTREEEPRKKMEAIFSYLGEVFGKEDCYISNWILGNEVNSYKTWNYAGEIDGRTYMTIYTETFQALYKAVRSKKSSAKVFICLDHNWNSTASGYSSKAVLDIFAKFIRRLQPDVKWNLAYHAYPSPLTEVAFWENHISNDLSSSIIHMGNLQVLTDYVRDTYGSETRILLSEQGFTSTQGEPLQAAALCCAYYIAACNPMVDGFHIRSLTDNEIEASQGLMMGIRGKEAYEVYCHMDQVETLSYTTPYVTLTGMKSWNEIPNYAPERLHTNYREE